VPVALARLDGMDSLLSIAQMPRGVPVATMAINGATNAGLLAARILGSTTTRSRAPSRPTDVNWATQASAQDRDLPRS
jgi:5-(carboxyamino)imidazole ribonucleotide mutase